MAGLFAEEARKGDETSADDRRRAEIAQKGASLSNALNAFAPTARKNDDPAASRHIPTNLVAGQLNRVEEENRAAGTAAHDRFTGVRRKMDIQVPPHVAELNLPDTQAKTLSKALKTGQRNRLVIPCAG